MKKRSVDRQAELSRRREAVAKNPNSSEAHFRLGTTLVQVGFLGEGQIALERALELSSDHVEAWVNLGGARLSRWDFKGCVDANQEALNRRPNLMRAHFNQGLAYMYLGDAERMVTCFTKVLELEPGNAAGHYHLAVGLHEMGRTPEARVYLSRAIGLGYSPEPSFVKALEEGAGSPLQVLELDPEPDKLDDDGLET